MPSDSEYRGEWTADVGYPTHGRPAHRDCPHERTCAPQLKLAVVVFIVSQVAGILGVLLS